MCSKSRIALALAAGVGLSAPASGQEAEGDQEAVQLETITVTGAEPDLKSILSPGEVSVVFPDDVKGEHKSLPDLLDQIPGVYARRVAGTGQYTTASIRGSSPSQVNIYIDGVPYNTASEAATDISTIPMSNVERVEVYRGTTPARFSGAPLGGAINIVTKRPDQARSSASAGVRSFGGRQAAGSVTAPLMDGTLLLGVDGEKSKGDFDYTKYAVRSLNRIVYSDGTTYAQRNPGSERPTDRMRLNADYEKANGLLKWQNQTLFAKWSYNHMDRFMPTAVNPDARRWDDVENPPVAGVESERRRQRVSEHNGAFGWRDNFGDLTLGATGTFMDQSKRYRNLDITGFQGVGATWSDYRTRRYGVSGDAAYELGRDWALGHRLEVRAEHLWETLHADANDREGSDLLTRFARQRSTIQAQDTITVRPLGDLEITPVGRLEKLEGPVLGSRLSPLGGASGDYDWKPSWSLSAKKRLFDGWEAFANTGTYNRYPSFYEIYGDGVYVSPDLDGARKARQLKREHGSNFDAGFGWTGAWDDWKGSFRLTYFQRRTEDAITFYQTPVGAKYINSGTTFTRGLEFEGNLAFGDRADLHLAGTLQDGRYVKGTYYFFGAGDAAERVDGKIRVLRNPDFSANARLNVHFLQGALTTFAEVRHTGRVYHAQFARKEQAYEEPLTTFDIGSHYKFDSGLKLSGGVTDIFDRGPKQRFTGLLLHQDPTTTDPKYWDLRPNVYYPQQGRTFYVSAAMTF